ncbi:hypothetical protein D9V41_10230 [Aeromicrobium phragmitis]|uniref:Uncharacterized protein n=1 Tax=Aeromicrobium phragmitis TaxID=2478914 RepID=A0A3L8PKH5_9ACTN|nr:hypothetical protein [Aeromicrobium phragmitis]RLV55821.1 hypothetical protein D9V41_10230 [Aeromicrobium phragmitis]
MIITWFLIGLLAIELAALLGAAFGGKNAPSRVRLAVVALEALVAIVVVRALAGWDEWTQWIWVLGVAVFAVGLAVAVFRWRELPVVEEGTAAWRTGGSVLYAAVLTAIATAVALTFV